MTHRRATVSDCLQILKERSVEFAALVLVVPAQLSFPTDGRGPRIKVSVEPGQGDQVPREVSFKLDHDEVDVTLDVAEDYQEYEAL